MNIIPFWRPHEEYGEFSNWFFSSMIIDNVQYANVEQYMMSEKAKLFGDMDIYNKIMNSNSPKEYKDLGRLVKNFDEKIWNENKYPIVLKGCLAKFSSNRNLKEKLLLTGDAILVEASPYDRIWGVKLSKNDPRINDPNQWLGENLLGKVLMEVREILRKE